MQIIGTTHKAYICHVSKDEMKILTGKDEPWDSNSHAHRSSTIVNVIDLSSHIKAMEYTKAQRKSAAETLRAAATVIESTPDAFTAPPEPIVAEQAAS
jgi:hypothetical protein